MKKILRAIFVGLILFGCSASPTRNTLPTTPTTHPSTTNMPFLDFDHPRLHEIAGANPLVIDEVVRTDRQGASYVAVIVETGDPMEKRELLMFQVQNHVSTLLYDLGPYYYITLNIQDEDHPSWLMSDRNFLIRAMLQLPVRVANGGNCYECDNLVLLSITPDGKAKDITPATKFTPKGFVWLTSGKHAGNIELVAVRYYEFDYGAESHVASPYAFRLFAWDRDKYVDVSTDESAFYNEKIRELTTAIQSTYGKPFEPYVMPFLSEIFFDYESSGRLEYGWQQIQEIGDLKHWDMKNGNPKDIQTYHKVFEELKQRYENDLMPTK